MSKSCQEKVKGCLIDLRNILILQNIIKLESQIYSNIEKTGNHSIQAGAVCLRQLLTEDDFSSIRSNCCEFCASSIKKVERIA